MDKLASQSKQMLGIVVESLHFVEIEEAGHAVF
jgi:hypothetical protein